MFNKAILAAALLSVGAITAGTAASAAEIGVRHTTGSSVRHIQNGRFEYESTRVENYSEDSAGFSVGIAGVSADGEGAFRARGAISAASASSSETIDGREPVQTFVRRANTEDNNVLVRRTPLVGNISESSTASSNVDAEPGTFVDGELTVSGSGYTRSLTGDFDSTTDESYGFNGTKRSNFSELSTFSR